MNGHQFGAVRERAFDLHFGNHRCDAVHHRVDTEDGRTPAHDFGHGATVANHLENLRRDERNGFGVIQLQTARSSGASKFASGVNEEFVYFTRCQVHSLELCLSGPVK